MSKKNRRLAGSPAGPAAAASAAPGDMGVHASVAPVPPGAATDEGDLWTTERVALDLGVAVEVIEELQSKACVAGVDYVDIQGNAEFTAAGVKKIRARVAERMSPTPTPPAPSVPRLIASPAAPTPRTEDLRLTRVFRWSKNVLAERPNGNEVVLSVKSAALLQPGMVLRGCQEGNGGWFYQGRLPRTLGERQMFFPGYEDPETKGALCKNQKG